MCSEHLFHKCRSTQNMFYKCKCTQNMSHICGSAQTQPINVEVLRACYMNVYDLRTYPTNV